MLEIDSSSELTIFKLLIIFSGFEDFCNKKTSLAIPQKMAVQVDEMFKVSEIYFNVSFYKIGAPGEPNGE